MKVIKLSDNMSPLVYLVRRWGKWYYIDDNGYWNPVKDVIVKLKKLKEE